MIISTRQFRTVFRRELKEVLKEWGMQSLLGPGFESWDNRNNPDYKEDQAGNKLSSMRDRAIKQVVREEVSRFIKEIVQINKQTHQVSNLTPEEQRKKREKALERSRKIMANKMKKMKASSLYRPSQGK